MYQPVEWLMVEQNLVIDPTNRPICFNDYFNMMFVMDHGRPDALGFREIYEPKVGLMKKGTGTFVMEEIDAWFNFRVNDKIHWHYSFNRSDATMLHFKRSPKMTPEMGEFISSVSVYHGEFVF